MVKNKEIDETDFEEFEKLGTLATKITEDRERIYATFNDFLVKYKVTEGGGIKGLTELFNTKEGREKSYSWRSVQIFF